MRKASWVGYGSVVLALMASVGLAHCGGDDPVAVDEDAGADTDVPDAILDTAPGETAGETSGETSTDAGDTSVDDGAVDGDAIVADADDAADVGDAGCGTLAATALDVYVDRATTKPSVGTAACPFKTIKEATDLAGVAGRTIHVKGGGGSLATYNETGALKVKDGVKLLGDGAASTKIVAAGACAEGQCAVEVAAGGTVDGFAITSTGNGVVTVDGTANAIVKNVLITEAQDGIVVLGPAELGGNVQSNKNKKNGLRARGTKTTKVTGTGNEFNENQENGILFEANARLDLSGATTASFNKGHGVHLKSTTPTTSTGQHVISNLTAKSNGRSSTGTVIAASNGIYLENNGSLKLRNSKLLMNSQNGLTVVFGSNALDIGPTVTDGGGNTFSVPTTVDRNMKAGICLENTGGSGSQPAEGNRWAACNVTPPAVTQTAVSGNCNSLGTQTEIAYVKKGGGGDNPVSVTPVTGCSVGSP